MKAPYTDYHSVVEDRVAKINLTDLKEFYVPTDTTINGVKYDKSLHSWTLPGSIEVSYVGGSTNTLPNIFYWTSMAFGKEYPSGTLKPTDAAARGKIFLIPTNRAKLMTNDPLEYKFIHNETKDDGINWSIDTIKFPYIECAALQDKSEAGSPWRWRIFGVDIGDNGGDDPSAGRVKRVKLFADDVAGGGDYISPDAEGDVNLRLTFDYDSSDMTLKMFLGAPPAVYNIKYEPNTAWALENMPHNGIKKQSVPYTIPDDTPTCIWHEMTFKGWDTDATGTGTRYQPGDVITDDAELTLYAIWEE